MRGPIRGALALLVAGSGWGQVSNSRLQGVVQDQSGALIPTARVVAQENRTAVSSTVISDAEGSFAFLSLPPGEYTVTVDAPGFRRFVLTGVALDPAAATVVDNIRMEIGPVTEAITVKAADTRVQTNDSQVYRVVALHDLEVLPQLERNPITLAIFQPGVQIAGGNIGFSRINGTRLGSNSVRVDGINATEVISPALAVSANAATTDSILEFRIVTHGGTAEYGSHAGAQVEMITRSGTNRWSGNGFDYLRNTVLNANDFFNNSSLGERPKLIQNVFGGSLGGPLIRNRTFFFASYQGTRARQQLIRNRTVLTSPARAGLFRWPSPANGAVEEFDIVRNDPRGRGIDPQMAALIKLSPAPNNFDIGDGLNIGGYRFNNGANSAQDGLNFRVDHNLRQNLRMFFRGSWLRADYIDALNGADAPFPGQLDGTASVRVFGYSIGADWTLTPRMVNEVRLGRYGTPRDQLRPARLPGPMMLPTTWTSPLNTTFARSLGATNHEFTDNLSMARGSHLLKIGWNWRFGRQSNSTQGDNSNANGIYPNVFFGRNNAPVASTIGPPPTAISPTDRARFENLYNELLGRIAQVRQVFYSDLQQFLPPGTPRVRNFQTREYGYFFQDDWRLRRNLTLNLGLRYEFSGVPSESNGLQATVLQAAQIQNTSQISDLRLVQSAHWYDNDFNNLAPRIGLAWDPWGNGKTAVRAQYGIFYDRLIGSTTDFIDTNTPGFSSIVRAFPNQAVAGSDVRVSDGIPVLVPAGTPLLQQPDTRQTNLALFNPHLRTGYLQQYSLTLQRELFRNTVVEAGFVGNRGVKLFMQGNPNQLRIQDGFLQAFREIQAFRSHGAPVPATNSLVRLFGSVANVISSLGTSTFNEGSAVAAADTVDTSFFAGYPAAGLSDFYLRNFPQYNIVALGSNDGRSYYDSLQLSVRRQAGALRFSSNYTLSKSIDTISSEGDTLARPIDSFNLRLDRARSDADRTHVFNTSVIYTPPIGRGRRFGGQWPRWLDAALGGWDTGGLAIWESGSVFSVRSGLRTAGDLETYADYTGDRNIGSVQRRGNGVFWFTPEEMIRFSPPAAGEIGSSGRNAFRGPRHFNVDLSLVKRFRIADRGAVAFRAEFYNLFNNTNFTNPGSSLANPGALGKISATASGGAGSPVGGTSGGPRIVQLVLRYDF